MLNFDPLDHDRSLAAYARMRAEPGLFRLGKGDRSLWLATRHEDVLALFKDKQRFARDVRRVGMQRGRDPLNRLIHNHLLNQDPPTHTRLRRLVGAAFLPEMIEAQRGAIEGVCERLLDDLAPRGAMDLIGDFSFVLPITVIGNLLGIPAADHGRLRAWSRAFVTSMRQIHRADDAAAIGAFLRYLRQTFAERRERPGDDLLSRLLQIEDAGERLSEDELYSMVMLLIVAGHETVMNALGNAVVTLLDRPEALAALRDGDAAVAPAVEELLRFDGPVDRTGARWALADMAFGGQRLRRGEGVIPVTSSANRAGGPGPLRHRFSGRRRGGGQRRPSGAWGLGAGPVPDLARRRRPDRARAPARAHPRRAVHRAAAGARPAAPGCGICRRRPPSRCRCRHPRTSRPSTGAPWTPSPTPHPNRWTSCW